MQKVLIEAEPMSPAPEESCAVEPVAPVKPTCNQPPIDDVQAVCVDVIDLGKVETPWGTKPKIKYVFEINQVNKSGYRATVSRTFTKSMYEKSALRPAIEKWIGCALTEEEASAFKPTAMKGRPCTLKLTPTISKGGNEYSKIVEISTPSAYPLTPSGKYRRWVE